MIRLVHTFYNWTAKTILWIQYFRQICIQLCNPIFRPSQKFVFFLYRIIWQRPIFQKNLRNILFVKFSIRDSSRWWIAISRKSYSKNGSKLICWHEIPQSYSCWTFTENYLDIIISLHYLSKKRFHSLFKCVLSQFEVLLFCDL